MNSPSLILLAFALPLSACVHLSKEQCLATNWQQVGYNDGVAGNAERNLASEIEDCQKFHISVNTQGYHQGWLTGLKTYCTPSFEQGKSDGSNGLSANGILNRNSRCLSGSTPLKLNQYQAGFRTGQQLYCTYDNGLTIGLQGNQPPEVCTGTLKQRFIKGWETGARQYCGNSANAYNRGKEGKPYPAACSTTLYYTFKAEYDRGTILRQRLSDVQNQINAIDSAINNLVAQWQLRKTFDARGYELGENISDEAKRGLHEVKELLLRRDHLQGQKNQLEVTR